MAGENRGRMTSGRIGQLPGNAIEDAIPNRKDEVVMSFHLENTVELVQYRRGIRKSAPESDCVRITLRTETESSAALRHDQTRPADKSPGDGHPANDSRKCPRPVPPKVGSATALGRYPQGARVARNAHRRLPQSVRR